MARLGRFARRGVQCERGAELIEMALVTPILILIFAGMVDFGMMFRSWEVVTNAAREGARVGVLPAYSNPENVRARVEQYMAASGVAATCTLVAATGTPATCPQPTNACTVCVQSQTLSTGAGTVTARAVTVRSRQSLPSLSVMGPVFGENFGNVPVSATSVMRSETAGAP